MEREKLILFRIKSLNNQIKRLMERTAIAENDANLTGNQYAVLGFLNERLEKQSVYQRDIEAEFNIRRSTASQMLKLLERSGYIERVNDEEDFRLKRILLTEKSKELDRIARNSIEEIHEQLTRGLSAEELEQFDKTLDKLIENSKP